MKLIGRKRELSELERCERSRKSELVCVYGRRRVGKTYLIEQAFPGQFAFRATGVESGNMRQQLKSFNQRLQEHGDTTKTIPKNWFEAFSRLDRVLSSESVQRSPRGKRIVFLDEFPWFATARSDFLMAFGEFWNRCGTANGDLLFIICGSATSWIIGNVLENTGCLYDRVTARIHLVPFCLAETETYFRDRDFGWSRRQIAECQMVFGGLPFFLDLLDPNESLASNINRLCFEPHALLRSESRKLLEATLKKSPVYGQMLDLLSSRKYGIPKEEFLQASGLAKGTFTRAVDDLVRCGYVREYKNRYAKRNPIFVQLVDPFLLFHYRFLSDEPQSRTWLDCIHDEGSYANWRGHAFEILCGQHVPQIKQALGIAGVQTEEFPWAYKGPEGGAQIDLVIERADGISNVCEMKYTDKPFFVDADYEANLLNKVDVFRSVSHSKQALKIVMITAEGIAGVAHTERIAKTLTLDDLF